MNTVKKICTKAFKLIILCTILLGFTLAFQLGFSFIKTKKSGVLVIQQERLNPSSTDAFHDGRKEEEHSRVRRHINSRIKVRRDVYQEANRPNHSRELFLEANRFLSKTCKFTSDSWKNRTGTIRAWKSRIFLQIFIHPYSLIIQSSSL